MDCNKQIFAGSFGAGAPNRKKNLFLATLFSSLLLAAPVVGIASVAHDSSSHGNSTSRRLNGATGKSLAVIRTACSSTGYPELCFSAVASTPEAANRMITSHKDVIQASLNLTTAAVQHNFFTVEKLISARDEALMSRDSAALHDCMDMIEETLEELRKVVDDLNMYPTKKPLQQYADDLNILMSAARTNQETFLEGFSHDEGDKQVYAALHGGLVHVEKMCSNTLAMIKNMTDTDMEIDRQMANRRNLGEEEKPRADDEGGWPEWLSHGDRRLLQSPLVKADVVVAADGRGNYRTVAEAVAAAPPNSRKRFVIRIKAGTYRENVVVPSTKTNIMFVGDGAKITTITGNRSNRSGSDIMVSGTVVVLGKGFLARDLKIENTAGPQMEQAVALRVDADLSAFFRCNILGYQDTLYVRLNKQFFVKCQIEGTVDFIFGDSAAFFQDCDILARYPGKGKDNMVTAQGRKRLADKTGIVIHRCRIGAAPELEPHKRNISTYLGRPWEQYSRTVIMHSTISDAIHPAGWHDWNGDIARLNTLYYGEYGNSGPGAETSKRPFPWKGFKVLTLAEAQNFTAENFIDGKQWLPSTRFPYSLGL